MWFKSPIFTLQLNTKYIKRRFLEELALVATIKEIHDMHIILPRFPIMIFFSILVFLVVIRIVVERNEFIKKQYLIYILSIIVVVLGMLFGKYGANVGLKWWIYYPIPMLINVFLPPLALKMNLKKSLFLCFTEFSFCSFYSLLFFFLF